MQGDIFQLESLVAVPKPRPAMPSKPAQDTQVSIYNEDDLSHMLYFSSQPHHHHHHHHHSHHHAHEQGLFTHPADAGTVFINTVADNMETNTPALSDCESCSGFETETDAEGAVTPPLATFEAATNGAAALDAYRRKGRRNAVSFEDGFEFPIFLGRQDEETCELAPQETHAMTSPPKKPDVEIIPASQHVKAISGPAMAWWPEPLDTMEYDWDVENLQWELQLEREKLMEREREGGIVDSSAEDKKYDPEPVTRIEGPLMSWWPTPLYDWSEYFYE
ncbi:hypothetical protein F5Y14DRAFT_450996 [Nemania sp. NC0429]|nr:hypothetical protein F5Y14DRAFT_450996 [Nemania sp. NC0429]